METINGEWYMKCCAPEDPARIRTPEELAALVRELGFLPLFSNAIPGFSAEERTAAGGWWSGDPASDPWEWRKRLAADDGIAYGKLFDGKAGFVSRDWFPVLANCRRDGYDFDALFDDGFASCRAKKLMDMFPADTGAGGRGLLSCELRELAGFGRGGEKNFAGVLTELQMQTYLIICDFRQRLNRRGEGYGWHIAVIAPPEDKWGRAFVTGGYREKPAVSRERILEHVSARFPAAEEDRLRKVLGLRPPARL